MLEKPYYKVEIGEAIVKQLKTITTENGYSQTLKSVLFDKVKVNIADYKRHEIPAIQLIDLQKTYQGVFKRSDSIWSLAIELALKNTKGTVGTIDQKALWRLQQDITDCLMKKPKLGLSWVKQINLIDEVTDLHTTDDLYTGILGLNVSYSEVLRDQN